MTDETSLRMAEGVAADAYSRPYSLTHVSSCDRHGLNRLDGGPAFSKGFRLRTGHTHAERQRQRPHCVFLKYLATISPGVLGLLIHSIRSAALTMKSLARNAMSPPRTANSIATATLSLIAPATRRPLRNSASSCSPL